MGIGRFAYTPILPIMQGSHMLSEQGAGYLASANYFGYLLGAICAGILKWRKGKQFYLSLYLIVNIITTIAMGITEQSIVWFGLRFISGFSSGLVFVLASSIVMDTLTFYKRMTWSGIFYSGVGIGIFICGLFVPIIAHYFSWEGAWVGIGIIATIIYLSTLVFVKDHPSIQVKEKLLADPKHDKKTKNSTLRWLIASYGCEGVGYIVSATFLVAFVQNIASLSRFPSVSWMFVGLAAAPSCYIWSLIAKKWGNMPSLQLAYLLQVVGVLLPVFLFNAIGALIGALLFGATFMGITTLFMAEARRIVVSQSNQVIGYFTFFYGIGQMIGPAIAGILITRSGNYQSALFFAASVLVCGMLLLGVVQLKEMMNKKTNQFI